MARQYGHMYKVFWGMSAALVCFLLVLPSLRLLPAGAQSPSLTETGREYEADVKIRAFFDSLIRGNSTAYDELLRQSPFGSSDAVQAVTELRNKVEELQTQVGGILAYEKYDTKRVGEDVFLVRYILKYEQAPVIWTFTFYRKPALTTSISSPNSAWMFIQLNFDADIKNLL